MYGTPSSCHHDTPIPGRAITICAHRISPNILHNGFTAIHFHERQSTSTTTETLSPPHQISLSLSTILVHGRVSALVDMEIRNGQSAFVVISCDMLLVLGVETLPQFRKTILNHSNRQQRLHLVQQTTYLSITALSTSRPLIMYPIESYPSLQTRQSISPKVWPASRISITRPQCFTRWTMPNSKAAMAVNKEEITMTDRVEDTESR